MEAVAADGKLGLVGTRCVICDTFYFGGRQFTCSQPCHDELVRRLIEKYGEFKKVVRMTTGVTYRVPTRDIIEKGILELFALGANLRQISGLGLGH